MYNVYFVRHGESQSNAGESTSHPAEVALTSRGHTQASCVADYFVQQDISLHLIITSPYQRAIQTAAYTGAHFPFLRIETWDIQEFTYLSSVHRQFTTVEERRSLVDDYWEQLLPTYKDASDSESFHSFIARVRLFIARLRRETRGNVVIFSHEQFINAVFWLLRYEAIKISRQAMEEYRDYCEKHRIPNAAIVKVQVSQGQFSWPQKPVTRHLPELVQYPQVDRERAGLAPAPSRRGV